MAGVRKELAKTAGAHTPNMGYDEGPVRAQPEPSPPRQSADWLICSSQASII